MCGILHWYAGVIEPVNKFIKKINAGMQLSCRCRHMIGIDKNMVRNHKQSEAELAAGIRWTINRTLAMGFMAFGIILPKDAPCYAAVWQDSRNKKERWD